MMIQARPTHLLRDIIFLAGTILAILIFHETGLRFRLLRVARQSIRYLIPVTEIPTTEAIAAVVAVSRVTECEFLNLV